MNKEFHIHKSKLIENKIEIKIVRIEIGFKKKKKKKKKYKNDYNSQPNSRPAGRKSVKPII